MAAWKALYEHTHELKGKQKENVENNKEKAFLSKRLATIDINVPIDFDEKSLVLDPPNKEACEELFAKLEFKTSGNPFVWKSKSDRCRNRKNHTKHPTTSSRF
jgi:5'-3' exonuclease